MFIYLYMWYVPHPLFYANLCLRNNFHCLHPKKLARQTIWSKQSTLQQVDYIMGGSIMRKIFNYSCLCAVHEGRILTVTIVLNANGRLSLWTMIICHWNLSFSFYKAVWTYNYHTIIAKGRLCGWSACVCVCWSRSFRHIWINDHSNWGNAMLCYFSILICSVIFNVGKWFLNLITFT